MHICGRAQGHIVAEVCDLDNEPLVKMVGTEHVQTVVSHDIIGRLMIQCARQHGLASVWQQIMGFEGAPIPVSLYSSTAVYGRVRSPHVEQGIRVRPAPAVSTILACR